MSLWGKVLNGTTNRTVANVAEDMPKWFTKQIKFNGLTFATVEGATTADFGKVCFHEGDKILIKTPTKKVVATVTKVEGKIHTLNFGNAEALTTIASGTPVVVYKVFDVEYSAMAGNAAVGTVQKFMLPITLRDIQVDKDSSTHPLAKVGITGPGWWEHRAVKQHGGKIKITTRKIVSVRSMGKTEGDSILAANNLASQLASLGLDDVSIASALDADAVEVENFATSGGTETQEVEGETVVVTGNTDTRVNATVA